MGWEVFRNESRRQHARQRWMWWERVWVEEGGGELKWGEDGTELN